MIPLEDGTVIIGLMDLAIGPILIALGFYILLVSMFVAISGSTSEFYSVAAAFIGFGSIISAYIIHVMKNNERIAKAKEAGSLSSCLKTL